MGHCTRWTDFGRKKNPRPLSPWPPKSKMTESLLKGTTIHLAQREKSNSFSVLGVAHIAKHGLVKNTREGSKERRCLILPISGQIPGIRDSRTWAMRQRILGSHTPPCHRCMIITTLSSMFCLAALQRKPDQCRMLPCVRHSRWLSKVLRLFGSARSRTWGGGGLRVQFHRDWCQGCSRDCAL
jgi:hypothetical protein